MIGSKKSLPENAKVLMITVIRFASHWMVYAFKIWIIYGRQELIAQNCKNICRDVIRTNGFTIRLQVICFSLSLKHSECSHSIICFEQFAQANDEMRNFWRFLYSSSTVSGVTHPRNHCKDFNAFFRRFFDNSQIGVSGTKNTVIKTQTGTLTQIKATSRQDKNTPNV